MEIGRNVYIPVLEALSESTDKTTSFISSLSDPLQRLSIKDLGEWLRTVLGIDVKTASFGEVEPRRMNVLGDIIVANLTEVTTAATDTTSETTPSPRFRSFRNHHHVRDQFAWGAIVCAAVFLVVLACVITAWWVHKKQQDFLRQRIQSMEARRGATAPLSYMVRTRVNPNAISPPPTYVEVVNEYSSGIPPSYTEAMKRKQYTCFNELKHSQSFLASDIKEIANIPDDPEQVLNPNEHREIILDAHDLSKDILSNALPPFNDSRSR